MSILFNTLMRLARIQRQPADRLALQQAVSELNEDATPKQQLQFIAEQLYLPKLQWLQPSEVDQTLTPADPSSTPAGRYYEPKMH